MKVISVDEAKENLEKILESLEENEEIIVKFKNKEFLLTPRKKRVLGFFKNKVRVDDDIKSPLPENISEEFYS